VGVPRDVTRFIQLGSVQAWEMSRGGEISQLLNMKCHPMSVCIDI